MSLFDDQLADFHELPPSFNSQSLLTDHKKNSNVPLTGSSRGSASASLHTCLSRSRKTHLSILSGETSLGHKGGRGFVA